MNRNVRVTLPIATLVVGGALLATIPIRNSSGSSIQSIDMVVTPRPDSILGVKPSSDLNIMPSYFASTTIALDPGHDDRNISTGVKGPLEAKLNLHIAEILNDSLLSKGYDVISTRYDGSWMNKKDLDINKDGKLNEADEVEVRSAYVKSNHVRLALMLHHNSWKRNRAVDGVEVYYLGAENEKKLHGRKRNLVAPAFCNVYSDSSKYIAEKIVQGFLDKGIKAKTMCCNLPLIRNNPARINILIELGYLSNKEDFKRAMSKEYQELYVGVVADVINANRDYIFGNEFYAPLLNTQSVTSESAQHLYDRLLFNHIKKGDGQWFDLNSGKQDNLAVFRTDYVQKEKQRRYGLFANFLKEKGKETYRSKINMAD